ncbi:MAG TPA: RecQ family ATP-dependent DNA helicase, partial [Bacteroidetes bacterium]|nr:RecQ family ATP-dependent DNA helicase [Bacteroidota bacterium]
MAAILYLDIETNSQFERIEDLGVILEGETYRGKSLEKLLNISSQATAICGHNIFVHDLEILKKYPDLSRLAKLPVIDTLYLSPLFRPNLCKHKLDKDYQQSTPYKNDPLADARLAKMLLADLINCFRALSHEKQYLYASLLQETLPFKEFFQRLPLDQHWKKEEAILGSKAEILSASIQKLFTGKICLHASRLAIIEFAPVELAYVLALLDTEKPEIRTPSWLLHTFPQVEYIFDLLCTKNCGTSDCQYCQLKLDPKQGLKKYFGFPDFRHFEGDGAMPLQEQVVRAALTNQSFLAIFPTGGGKSLTFQLPALIRGAAKGALTVVISPLVALMKDQVDVLREKGVINAVALNSLLSPLERSDTIQRVKDGLVSLLYLAPESLRSNVVLRLLTGRLIDRFVIDEAHCFSAWGQDFRVDYLYIAEFIHLLQEKKGNNRPIQVSCFTATARPEVIQEIQAYFESKSGLKLKIFQTHQQRTNLTYRAIELDQETDKFEKLVNILEEKDGPAIVYVSRVKTTIKLEEGLKKQGLRVGAYNGKMESKRKNEVQNAFKSGEIDIIVATSAFGMGVDKDDVSLVIHYEISNSLENYVQEAGRAGRDPKMQAKCIILFNESDLDKHFELLQGLKLNQKEISQIWQGIKRFKTDFICRSALEIAKKSGWDEELRDLETRVKAAINALESINYLDRQQNSPRIFATGLIPDNFESAMVKVKNNAHLFTARQQDASERILQYLFGKYEARVDYMSEILGIGKRDTATV